ncbi:LysR substrate-binding domain-containing protein [Halomonas huangheensis]|uniref:HTH lysR-type domain-containing protein n=1 Tax=Halomonas huangheensis TaxID=1178482 RepID=W1NCG7_9GAMM|nr:LysR substrate-binding domain-containing protein [Halomonas huangheensis]ALM52904.1 LysR family transcriptional regulator [Halomonas huangheensis]ERL53178.1 hypothetical protein BJB45_18055 [Halomonas huangheensis]
MKIERLPLNGLRAFAEAAREGSFKLAAERLGVTPGAVSRQIKQLEENLGVALFERHANGVRTSAAGRRLAEDVDAGLARIAAGMDAITQLTPGTTRLLLSAPPSLAQLWLLPRLTDFEAQHRQLEISIDASQGFSEPSWYESDARLALSYGRPPRPGVRNLPLFEDMLVPVCSPALLKQSPIQHPRDLLGHTLFDVSWSTPRRDGFPGWKDWFAKAGMPEQQLPTLRRYSLYGLALDQAIAGRGVILASLPVVADRLASGVLTRPFGDELMIPSPFRYELVIPDTGVPPRGIKEFMDWLLEEAQRFREITPGMS